MDARRGERTELQRREHVVTLQAGVVVGHRLPSATTVWLRKVPGKCDLCDTLGAFLASRSQRVLAWPLATDGRRHMHVQIDSGGLPVRHQTRRQGRPYTLELTKTDELFTRDTNARHKAVTDLAWLTSTRGDASARP